MNSILELIDRYTWSHFITITNRSIIGKDALKQKYKRFFKHLNKDDIYFNKYVMSFVLLEKYQRGGYHIHSLITDIDKDKTILLERKSVKCFGMSKIKEYDINNKAKYYIANKCNDYNWDIIRINSRKR